MILTRRISLRKLFTYTRVESGALLLFTVVALALMQYVSDDLLRALSYATGFLGSALAFLIGFRNNAAYGRWWEAQRLWSQLKYDSRNFALLLRALVSPVIATAELRPLIDRQIAFAWRLNRYLRKLPPGEEVSSYLSPEAFAAIERAQTPPMALLDKQAEALRELFERGHLDSHRLVQLSTLLTRFGEVLGGCERLKKTPFPMQYTWFMRYALYVFLLLLPLSLVGHLGYAAVAPALAIGYVFVMLEYVGRYVEHPFENDVNDVPMDYLARTIEIDLLEWYGATERPAPIAPRGLGYLY